MPAIDVVCVAQPDRFPLFRRKAHQQRAVLHTALDRPPPRLLQRDRSVLGDATLILDILVAVVPDDAFAPSSVRTALADPLCMRLKCL